MGLDKFEKQIKDHQEYFEKDPTMDHMDKFFFKLKEDEKSDSKPLLKWNNNSWWIGIAASISLLVSIGWFLSQQEFSQNTEQQMGLSLELNEIKSYYTKESNEKLEDINNCSDLASTTKDLIKTTKVQLMKLDFNADKIESKLKQAAGNTRLELAYIQNLKAKNDLLDKMHTQICGNQNVLTQ